MVSLFGADEVASSCLRHRNRLAPEARDPAANLGAGRLKTGLENGPGVVEPWRGLVHVPEPVQVGSARHTQSKYRQKTECLDPEAALPRLNGLGRSRHQR